ncbi:PP2C family protein-serine/threonine phosphatase [Yinghuangia seranimata]|uniref:PP2C family protein-serine/threonine phosphatase n=1 Tax=Yinghuangia seranimata TaxID=408067 RepID=UPI00248D1181|nr:protein phosphatase 2C domain-containing protein [Yinghuangia seranimata]MDI2127761.1 protein phosphatase 2C domain-containing protein [Yinghuangia seranimata]
MSDRGSRRTVNADAVALATVGPWTIGVVCDGVSLSARPERAAQVAADVGCRALAQALADGTIPELALQEAVVRAGHAVTALASSRQASPPPPDPTPESDLGIAPACTFTAAVAGPDGVWCGWVGDTRAYWLPDTGIGMCLTEDDTAADDALTAWLGADAPPPTAHVRGYRPPPAPDTPQTTPTPGRLLLCTDGLWRYLPTPDALRAAVLRAPTGSTPALTEARALVAHALSAGGADNVTALLVLTG